jgi:hypothetical protein
MDPLLETTLRWYTHLASQPGFKEHAWFQAKQLAKDHPSVFWKLPDLLVEAMQRNRNEQ